MIVAILAISACVRFARIPHLIFLAFGWFVICWLPVSNIVPTGVVVAERALYLSSAGMTLAIGSFARKRYWGAIAAALLVATIASSLVASSWRTEESLWANTVNQHPRSPRGHAALGLARLKRSDPAFTTAVLQQAEDSFDVALSLNGRAAEALYGKGVVLLYRGQPAEARPFLQAAVKQRPGDKAMEDALRQCEALLEPRR